MGDSLSQRIPPFSFSSNCDSHLYGLIDRAGIAHSAYLLHSRQVYKQHSSEFISPLLDL